MKTAYNPYTIGFGRIPAHYISRDILIEDIIDNISGDEIQGQAYKLTGIRGTGKTVTLTAIERKLCSDDEWIVIGVKPEGNHTMIRSDYVKTLGVSTEVGDKLAAITKGYAFAYQALGKYMWESGEKDITEEVLARLDEALSEKVYQKIWSELTPKERWFLGYIVNKDKMPVSELLELTGQNKSQFSKPRQGLKKKGVIDTSIRGMITIRLPRLKEFVESQTEDL